VAVSKQIGQKLRPFCQAKLAGVELFLRGFDFLAINGRATDAPIDVVINDLRFIILPLD